MLRSAAAYSSRHKSFLFLSNEILFVKFHGDDYKDDESEVTKPDACLLGDLKKYMTRGSFYRKSAPLQLRCSAQSMQIAPKTTDRHSYTLKGL